MDEDEERSLSPASRLVHQCEMSNKFGGGQYNKRLTSRIGKCERGGGEIEDAVCSCAG